FYFSSAITEFVSIRTSIYCADYGTSIRIILSQAIVVLIGVAFAWTLHAQQRFPFFFFYILGM
ncbi:hypothetical protein QIH36_27835, partial [Klebsiella pneumoniae]|nr:hypothetical protein [Klebsiella pneumoniae]